MKKIKFAILLSAVAVAVSCKSDLKPQDSSETPTVETADVSPSNPAQTITATEAQPMPQQAAVAQTAPGMNPPHGQPGHKCEIAVGAPLNSTPGTAAQPQVAQTPQAAPPMNVTTSAVPQKVAKGMNPAHGQPGHRCDIAVGQPLSSPPATGNKPAPTPITAPIVQTSSAPALLTPNANQAVAAGTNPPHGQDGHRCDIAVGAALPKS